MCILGSLRVNRILGQWVCLEVNILCIIPVLVYSITEDSILTGVKYFISQRAASLMFVLGLFLSIKIRVAIIFITLSIFFMNIVLFVDKYSTKVKLTLNVQRCLDCMFPNKTS